MLETGWLGFAGSQIPPDAYNYAGINAFDGRASLPELPARRLAPEPVLGNAAARRARCRSSSCAATPTRPTKTMPGRLISAPSDRVGDAPLWEYFGGSNCPCGKLSGRPRPNYGITVIQLYSQALVSTAASPARACPTARRTTGRLRHRLLGGDRPTASCTRSGPRTSTATCTHMHSTRRSSAASPRRRRPGTGSSDATAASSRSGRRTSTARPARCISTSRSTAWNAPPTTTATGSSPTTAASSASATRTSTARWAAHPYNQPILGMERTHRATATGCSHATAASSRSATPSSTARSRSTNSRRRSCRCSPPPTARATGCSRADGHVFRFGDAAQLRRHRRLHQLRRRGPAARVADGKGYWIATADGASPVRRRQQPRLPDLDLRHVPGLARGRLSRRTKIPDRSPVQDEPRSSQLQTTFAPVVSKCMPSTRYR